MKRTIFWAASILFVGIAIITLKILILYSSLISVETMVWILGFTLLIISAILASVLAAKAIRYQDSNDERYF